MSSRTNKTPGRASRINSRDPISARPRVRQSPRAKSPEGYPVRVKSHDGYIECLSSVLARIAEGSSGPSQVNTRLHLKFEIGGSLIGKRLAMNYGKPGPGDNPRSIGVLLGRREPSRLLIVSYRPMSCWPPGDENRSLSEQWDRSFGGLVARIRWDPKLSGLQPVGWYRAEPDASLSLSRRDLDLFNRFFPEQWQIGLILKSGESATAGRIFLRELDRSIRPEAGFQDFVVQRDAERPRVVVAPPSKAVAPSSWPGSAGSHHSEKRSQFLWPAAALLAAAGIVGGAWWSLHPAVKPIPRALSQAPSAIPDVKQEATQKADAIWQQWQKEAAQSQSDSPQPSDGDAASLHQDAPADIGRDPGALPSVNDLPASTNAPASTDAPASAAVLRPPAKEARVDRLQAQSGKQGRPQAQSGKQNQPRQLDRVERQQTPRTFRPPDAAARAGIVADIAPPTGDRLATLGGSSAAPRQTEIASPPPVSAPSHTDAAPMIAPISPARTIPPPTAPVVSSPPAQPPTTTASVRRTPVETATAAPVPASGRLIWTGRLKKNELLVFEAGKPSVGSSTGSLPGKPVSVSVSPGDLTHDGIVIYSAVKPRPGSTQEAPGPQNGWNKTVRDWDPNRATDVEVVEAPGPQNGWKRLVLRSRKSRDSVIMVEWKTQF